MLRHSRRLGRDTLTHEQGAHVCACCRIISAPMLNLHTYQSFQSVVSLFSQRMTGPLNKRVHNTAFPSPPTLKVWHHSCAVVGEESAHICVAGYHYPNATFSATVILKLERRLKFAAVETLRLRMQNHSAQHCAHPSSRDASNLVSCFQDSRALTASPLPSVVHDSYTKSGTATA